MKSPLHGHGHRSKDRPLQKLTDGAFFLSRVSSFAGFCPVARRREHLDSDYKRIGGIGLTVDDAGLRVEIAADGANRNRLIGLPTLLGHNSGTVATYVDGGCEFEGWMTKVIKIHKHLHRKTIFLPAQGGRLWQRCSFGPGGPAIGSLPVRTLEAMVRRDNGPLGWSLPMATRCHSAGEDQRSKGSREDK